MFGNGEEAFETPVETGKESTGLEAGLPVFVATPCFVLVGTPLISSPVTQKLPS